MKTLKKATSCFELSSHVDDPKSPYEVGKFLQLRLCLSSWPKPLFVKAEIIKCFLPFTQSQVMLVRLSELAHNLDGEHIVKLYDRRYLSRSSQKRKPCPEWSPSLEKDYRRHILQCDQSGCSESSLSSPATSPINPTFSPTSSVASSVSSNDSEEEGEESRESKDANKNVAELPTELSPVLGSTWRDVQDEGDWQEYCLDLYQSEVEVYGRLEHLQGEDIPRLIARVAVPLYHHSKYNSWNDMENEVDMDKTSIKGVLLQHIANAFTLADLYDNENPPPPPQEAFQYLGDEAIDVIGKIRECEVLNTDVAPRNSLVCWSGFHGRWKVFLMDFGHCIFREDESDYDWREEQWHEDEEGAMGLVLSRNIERNRGGGYWYCNSLWKQAIGKEYGCKPVVWPPPGMVLEEA